MSSIMAHIIFDLELCLLDFSLAAVFFLRGNNIYPMFSGSFMESSRSYANDRDDVVNHLCQNHVGN